MIAGVVLLHLHHSSTFWPNIVVNVKWETHSMRVVPVFLIELQHHVVCGDAERPSTLVVLFTIDLIHVRRRHRAVVGVVVGVDGASIVPCEVKLDFWEGRERNYSVFHFVKKSWWIFLKPGCFRVKLTKCFLTSGEEPVGVLDDGLDDADDLQGNCRHHLCDVPAADMGDRLFYDGT